MKSLIKLADNPLELDDKDEKESKMAKDDTKTNKGRKVSGPRMKLSDQERFDRLERSVGTISRAVRTMAKGMYKMPPDEGMGGGGMGGMEDDYEEDADPMAVDDIDMEDEDELELGDDYYGSDFDPYGGEEDKPERGEDDTLQDQPEDIPGISARGNAVGKAKSSKSKVAKDDAASSYGEKDSDIPGNRPADMDKKDKDAGEYLIQGGPGDGPGPVSKATVRAISQIVRSELRRAGTLRKAETPGVGARDSKVDKAEAVDVDQLQNQMRGRSFQEINRFRVEIGDLPAGIL